MLNSPALEVAIGLVFCFAAVALIASTVKEAIASLVGLRSRTLFSGIKTLLNDPKFANLAHGIYNHALVHPYGDGKVAAGATFKALGSAPSYVAPAHFATALIESMQKIPGNLVQLKTSIDAIDDDQIKTLLQGMYSRASGDVDKFHAQVAAWFDTSMDRLSGTYKRYAQVITLVAGLVIAASMNVDSVSLCQELWKHPDRAALITSTSTLEDGSANSNPKLASVFQGMGTLPIGHAYPAVLTTDFLWDLVGILITASAAMFGAPFWFDILQKLVQLRSSGPKPSDKAGANKKPS